MTFETKVRQLILELLEPFLEKSIKDRELIYRMEKEDEKIKKRINLLEISVFKQNLETHETIFDEIDRKMLDMKIMITKVKQDTKHELDKSISEMKSKQFDFKQRVMKVENFKEQIEINKQTIHEILEHTKT